MGYCLDEHVQSLSDTVEKISQSQVNILQDTAALTKTVHDIQTAIEPLLKPVAVHRSPNRIATWPNKMPSAPLGTAAGGGTAAVRWAASADAFGNQATGSDVSMPRGRPATPQPHMPLTPVPSPQRPQSAGAASIRSALRRSIPQEADVTSALPHIQQQESEQDNKAPQTSRHARVSGSGPTVQEAVETPTLPSSLPMLQLEQEDDGKTTQKARKARFSADEVMSFACEVKAEVEW